MCGVWVCVRLWGVWDLVQLPDVGIVMEVEEWFAKIQRSEGIENSAK
jgi:extradiol dioxygenase family protein